MNDPHAIHAAVGSLPSLGSPASLMAGLMALALLPFAAVTLTSFAKISVVLSLLRSALGTQQAPPTVVLTGLAAVLSLAVMSPIVEAMVERARSLEGRVSSPAELVDAAAQAAAPLRAFLEKHAGDEERQQFLERATELRGEGAIPLKESSWAVLLPAFLVTELREAFTIGFLLFLPFLVVDMLVANILVALGMQTLSPTQVSLPFKILLFVAVNGWSLVSNGLIAGYR